MIDKILEFALRQRVFVLLGALALLGAGIWAALRLPIDATPDIIDVDDSVEAAARRGDALPGRAGQPTRNRHSRWGASGPRIWASRAA